MNWSLLSLLSNLKGFRTRYLLKEVSRSRSYRPTFYEYLNRPRYKFFNILFKHCVNVIIFRDQLLIIVDVGAKKSFFLFPKVSLTNLYSQPHSFHQPRYLTIFFHQTKHLNPIFAGISHWAINEEDASIYEHKILTLQNVLRRPIDIVHTENLSIS